MNIHYRTLVRRVEAAACDVYDVRVRFFGISLEALSEVRVCDVENFGRTLCLLCGFLWVANLQYKFLSIYDRAEWM